MGDAGGFGRSFFGRTAAFPVVGLLFLANGGDGEESTVLTNLTSISSRIVAIGPVCFAGVAVGLLWRSCRFCGGFGGG
jgi:hypothetical protein